MKHYLQTRNDESYDLFDAFNDLFRPVFFDEQNTLRTNIRETDTAYALDVEMPGYTKEQIKVTLDNGYLIVSAKKDEKENGDGKYLRKEIIESCQRSFYVGGDVTEEQIKAKYDNGILSLSVPKSAPKRVENKFIAIE